MSEKLLSGRTVSVIVPVGNVREYLDECVRSILGQTYADLEVILVDDGSADGSASLCDRWQEQDPRVRVIHQENTGVSGARNAGIMASAGDYLGFVDADDWIEPGMYRALLESIVRDGSDVAMCGYFDYPDGTDRPVAKGVFPVPVSGYREAVYPILRRNGYFSSVCNKLFDRKAIFRQEGVVLMDPSLAYGEDEEWLFRVISRCERLTFVPDPCYHWRPRTGSRTRTVRIDECHLSLLKAKQKVIRMLPDDPEVRRFARGRMFNDCHILKVNAYLSGQADLYTRVSGEIGNARCDWLRTSGISLARKVKVIVLDILMRIRAPKTFVRRISGIR